MKINIVTLCSGMEAQGQALKRLCADYSELEWDLLAWSEIEPNAIKAHNAVFPEYADRNLGDMTKCDYSAIKDKVDMLFYSTPCQSVSCAGQRKGMKEGDDAASALIWHTRCAIRELKPRIAILENVKGMIMGENRKEFYKWQHELESYGYTNFAKVLDARDYGVAQHRERLFMVSILDCEESYHSPEPFKLEKRLKDYLETDVPESYYLKAEQVKNIIEHCDKKQAQGCGFSTQFTTQDSSVATILARYGNRQTGPYVQEPAIIGYSRFNDGVGISYHVKDVSNTIHTSSGQGGNTDQYVKEPVSDVRYSVQSNQSGGYFHQPMTDVCKTIKTDGKMGVIESFQIGISIHPLNRKMEFNGYRSVRCDVAPTIQSFGSCVPSSACGGKIVKADGIAPTVMENHGNVTAVAEPQIIQLFQLYPDSDNTQVGRVYDINGIFPTLSTACGGHHEPKILTQVRTEKAKELRRKGIDVFANRQLIPREDDWSNAITTATKDNLAQEPYGEVLLIPDPSVWVDPETNKAYYYQDGWLWRIRKLLPTECLRLMDVSEEDIENIRNCGISKTAIYSLAGNSVVVNVLYHIFHKLFVDKSNPNQQITLF